jgi:hypothetical protein
MTWRGQIFRKDKVTWYIDWQNINMSKTRIWILVISLGLLAALAICGIRVGNSFVKWMEGRKIIGHPPHEYAELFRGPDSGKLRFLETIVDRYRNPITRFRYPGKCEILETRLDFSDSGKLGDMLNIVQAGIPDMGLTDSYDQLKVGTIAVNFKNLGQPDSSFSKITLRIEGRGFENYPGNDSVRGYFLEKGYFSISRSLHGKSDIYSSEQANHGWSGPSTPTVLLFKSRGNSVFILVGSPIFEKTQVPQDLLLRLVTD